MIGRRGLLGMMAMAYGGNSGRPVNAPPAPALPGMLPAPQLGIVRANQVIVAGPNSGVFDYSPTLGVGNLIASIAPSAGTDSYGNPYLQGVAAYSFPLGVAVSLTAVGSLQFWRLIAGNWVNQALLSLNGLNQLGAVVSGLTIGGGATTQTILAPTGDTTGAGDSALLAAAQGAILLLPGSWYLAAPFAWANAEVAGSGDATIVAPGSAWAGAALFEPGSNTAIRNMRGYGGSPVRAANPPANFIQIAPGAQWWRAEDIRCDEMNGHVLLCQPATGSHGRIRGVGGEHNAQGVAIDNGLGGSVTAEISVRDLDIQNCEVGEVLFCAAVTDIIGGDVNGSILAGVAANAISINGSCQTIELDNLDVGGGAGTGVVVLQKAGGTSSPSDIRLSGKAQGGAAGVVVSDACSRLTLDMLAARNQGDGFLFSGTGNGIVVRPAAHLNNQGGGGGYDVDVTSTAHVLLSGPAYDVGGPVTANLNITVAGNHVTEANPPAGRTTAGNAPAGW